MGTRRAVEAGANGGKRKGGNPRKARKQAAEYLRPGPKRKKTKR